MSKFQLIKEVPVEDEVEEVAEVKPKPVVKQKAKTPIKKPLPVKKIEIVEPEPEPEIEDDELDYDEPEIEDEPEPEPEPKPKIKSKPKEIKQKDGLFFKSSPKSKDCTPKIKNCKFRGIGIILMKNHTYKAIEFNPNNANLEYEGFNYKIDKSMMDTLRGSWNPIKTKFGEWFKKRKMLIWEEGVEDSITLLKAHALASYNLLTPATLKSITNEKLQEEWLSELKQKGKMDNKYFMLIMIVVVLGIALVVTKVVLHMW